MQALLEQNFDDLYSTAKDRIEKCIKPIEPFTTLDFFIIWSTINEILFDVFHNTRFMYFIGRGNTDAKLSVCFHDKLMNTPTKKLEVSFLKEFKLISYQEFVNMPVDDMYKYVCECRTRGYSEKFLSNHFGKSDTFVSNLLHCRKKGSKPNKRLFDDESIVARAVLKRMVESDVPFIMEVWNSYFTEAVGSNVSCCAYMNTVRNYSNHSVYGFTAKHRASADRLFLSIVKSTKEMVSAMIDQKRSAVTTSSKKSISRHLHIYSKNGKYVGDGIEKLKMFQKHLIQILTTSNKEGGEK